MSVWSWLGLIVYMIMDMCLVVNGECPHRSLGEASIFVVPPFSPVKSTNDDEGDTGVLSFEESS